MSMEFTRLSEVEVVETATDTDKVLIEQNGEIKRVPKTEVGGAGAIATAIIKSSDYDDAIMGMQQGRVGAAPTTYECLNMTFEEAYQIMADGKPLSVVGMIVDEAPMNMQGVLTFLGEMPGVQCLVVTLYAPNGTIFLFWTADGLSTEEPSRPK